MLSENLKKYREEKGFSKLQLAAKSGVLRQTIMLIETKRTKSPGLKTLKKLSDALGVSVDELIK